MPRNESLLVEVRAALARADWDAAERALVAHAAADRAGDPESLLLFRRLEDGRGTRNKLLARVATFVARHPERARDPRVRVERGWALRASGDGEGARAEFLAARDQLDALRIEGDLPEHGARTLALAHAGVGLTHLTPLDQERARRALQSARSIAKEAGLLDLVSFVDLGLAHVEVEAGDVARATKAYRDAVAAYERLGDEGGIRHASYNLGMCLAELGRDRAARRWLVRARDLASKRGELWYQAFATLLLGDLERKANRHDAAEAMYAEAEKTFARLGGPTPTEKAWVDIRRAEGALERGDLRAARRLACTGLDERVEPTPRVYASLILAAARARSKPSASSARALERVALEAERMALNETTWRARTLAARLRLDLATERRLDGGARDEDELAIVRAHVRHASSALEGTMASLKPSGRAAYLRDAARSRDARTLLELDAMTGVGSGAPTLEARAAFLRLLDSITEIAQAEDPRAVARKAADAIAELARVRRVHLFLDPVEGERAIEVGRDFDGRDLPARARPTVDGRGARAMRGGVLLLEGSLDDELSAELLELVDALAAACAALVEAARTRARLRVRSEQRAEQAEELAVELARAAAALGEAHKRLPPRADDPEERFGIVGRSAPMRDLFARLERLRGSELPVLVTGESGTGKELVARAIHESSPRRDGAFVAVNCGAFAEGLLESELFGHVRGAFSGATRDAPGLFAVAHRGTLLLDEVGEMSLPMQAKLLRVLQDGEVRPVGAERARKVDVRVIAATHRDLERMVEARAFREDLFYRLHVLTVHVPPLRARGDDALLLARRFLGKGKRLAPDAAAWLVGQSWPGNVRELRAVVEAASVLADQPVITANDLAPKRVRSPASPARVPERLEELEAWAIARALDRHDGSKVAAARSLGIGRATLYRKLLAYGIG